jgi:hypothetical protein
MTKKVGGRLAIPGCTLISLDSLPSPVNLSLASQKEGEPPVKYPLPVPFRVGGIVAEQPYLCLGRTTKVTSTKKRAASAFPRHYLGTGEGL